MLTALVKQGFTTQFATSVTGRLLQIDYDRAAIVFDYAADPGNEPQYNPRMVRAEKITPGPEAKGTL